MFEFQAINGVNPERLKANGIKIVFRPKQGDYAIEGPNNTTDVDTDVLQLNVSGAWQTPPGTIPVFTVGGTGDTRNKDHIEQTLGDFAWKWRKAFPGWQE